jgi:hypothetical protein
MEKLDSLFSVQISPQMAKATTSTAATTQIQFYTALKRDKEKKNCVECNEPIFMVKRMT